MDQLNIAIRRLALWPLTGFAAVCLALTYWQILKAPELNAADTNNRAQRMLQRIEPGAVLSSEGVEILGAVRAENGWKRVYPDTSYFCHLTGYNNRTGLQRTLAEALFAQGRYSHPWEDLLAGGGRGNDVALTIRASLQRTAHQLMRGRPGAVIAMDPRDGALLCLYSSPTYDAEAVTRTQGDYDVFTLDPSRPELNRPLQGLYAPGSVFKILTAAAAIDAGLADPETRLRCGGSERVGTATVKCRRASGHGEISVETALADSCNIVLAKLTEQLGPERFRDYVKRFHLLDAANLPLPVSNGRMSDFSGPKAEKLAVAAGYGQGETLITPMAIARLTATIARGGQVVQPSLVARVTSPGGTVLKQASPEELDQAVSAETARAVAGMMRATVESGTGKVADLGWVKVAAKTGSAELGAGQAPHAWFTCFAPYDEPRVVVTVIVENGGSGAETAGPVAVEVLSAALTDSD